MNWGIALILVAAILGTALIVGGTVVLRSGRGTGSRAFGAVAIAVGIVLWAFIVFITPTSVSQGS